MLKQTEEAVCIYPNKSQRTIPVPENGLLFTITQIPVIYKLTDSETAEIVVEYLDGSTETISGDVLPKSIAQSLLNRTSNVSVISVAQPSSRFLK